MAPDEWCAIPDPGAREHAAECLSTVFGEEYRRLTAPQADLVISALIALADREHIGNFYQAASVLRWRVHPASLEHYAEALPNKVRGNLG
jgi:hypothetical protein